MQKLLTRTKFTPLPVSNLRDEPPDITEQPTVVMPVIKAPLRRDKNDRPYVLSNNQYEETEQLIQAAMQRFLEAEGVYPAVIILSAWRYLVINRPYWDTMGIIPILYYKNGPSFEVLVLGK